MGYPICKPTESVRSRNRMAVSVLDIFTKNWCVDIREKNDLKFMCRECPFEQEDGKCQVKMFKNKFYPQYKDFGAMGDL